MADEVLVYASTELEWDANSVLQGLNGRARVFDSIEAIVAVVEGEARPGDHVLVMSNGGFGNIHQRLLDTLGGSR